MKHPEIQQTIIANSLLEPLCKKIRPFGVKKINQLTINCPEELLAFLNLSSAKKVTRKGKKRPAEQSVEALQQTMVNEANEHPTSQNPSSFFNKRRKSNNSKDLTFVSDKKI